MYKDDCKELGESFALALYRLNAYICCAINERHEEAMFIDKRHFLSSFSQELKEGESVEDVLQEAKNFCLSMKGHESSEVDKSEEYFAKHSLSEKYSSTTIGKKAELPKMTE